MSTTPNIPQTIADDINAITEKFLGWPLPHSVCADRCTTEQGEGRVGTNLLSYVEAKQMFTDLVAPYLMSGAAAKMTADQYERAHRLFDGNMVELLMRCQNGEATCIFTAQIIEAKLTAALARVAALEEANRGLAEDKARLDWLEKSKTVFHCTSDAADFSVIVPQFRLEEHGNPCNHATLRQAIDAARGSEAKS